MDWRERRKRKASLSFPYARQLSDHCSLLCTWKRAGTALHPWWSLSWLSQWASGYGQSRACCSPSWQPIAWTSVCPLPPSGVYVIRCESLQIPPPCVIWAGRSILPPSLRRNNGESPVLPGILGNLSGQGGTGASRGAKQFQRRSKLITLNGFSFPPQSGYICSSFIHCLLSLLPLTSDSRRDCESRLFCCSGQVTKSPF